MTDHMTDLSIRISRVAISIPPVRIVTAVSTPTTLDPINTLTKPAPKSVQFVEDWDNNNPDGILVVDEQTARELEQDDSDEDADSNNNNSNNNIIPSQSTRMDLLSPAALSTLVYADDDVIEEFDDDENYDEQSSDDERSGYNSDD
jgi:hypothetical protein